MLSATIRISKSICKQCVCKSVCCYGTSTLISQRRWIKNQRNQFEIHHPYDFQRLYATSNHYTNKTDKEQKKYDVSECCKLLSDKTLHKQYKREVVDYVINHKLSIPIDIWSKCVYQLYSNRQLDHVIRIYNYLNESHIISQSTPTMYRYFIRSATETSNLSLLTTIWKLCNKQQWYSENEYYITHAMYIRGLLKCNQLNEAMCEYQMYNRYHSVNNRINTIVLQGLVEGGYYRDCLLFFASIVTNSRFTLQSSYIYKNETGEDIDWYEVLKHTTCGYGMYDRIPTYFDHDTKQRLFSVSLYNDDIMSQISRELGLDEELHLHFHRTDIVGDYITLNKRAYHHSITACCKLHNLAYAHMLYDILISNRIQPRKNTFYSLISYIGEVDANPFVTKCIQDMKKQLNVQLTKEDHSLIQSLFQLRLCYISTHYIDDFINIYGDPVQKCEDNSVLMLDLFSIPESVAIPLLLHSFMRIARLVNHDFLWLKGALSIKMNLKYEKLFKLIKHDLYPHVEMDQKGFILRIPILSIQNWFQKQGKFSQLPIAEFLTNYRCDFNLNSGQDDETFKLINCMEAIGNRDISDLTVPIDRRNLENDDMDKYIENSKLVEEEKKRKQDVRTLNTKLSKLNLKLH